MACLQAILICEQRLYCQHCKIREFVNILLGSNFVHLRTRVLFANYKVKLIKNNNNDDKWLKVQSYEQINELNEIDDRY